MEPAPEPMQPEGATPASRAVDAQDAATQTRRNSLQEAQNMSGATNKKRARTPSPIPGNLSEVIPVALPKKRKVTGEGLLLRRRTHTSRPYWLVHPYVLILQL